MNIAVVGLGRMGTGIARRLLNKGHSVWVYNRTPQKTDALVSEGARGAYSLEQLVKDMPSPRLFWLMLPAGEVTERHIEEISKLAEPGDIVVDGANSYYRDDLVRERVLEGKGIGYLDVGVSGGIWGEREGYCLMVGGKRKFYEKVEPVLKALAPEGGYLYCGPAGAGHFVKMVHYAIEYALMEAYAEGFELLWRSPYGKTVKMADVAGLWQRGSVIRSWLLELLERAFRKEDDLSSIKGYVEDSGEGRWSVKEAIDMDVPFEGIAHSLFRRFRSRQEESFAEKILAALRAEFGGHRVIRDDKV
ncbi:MAG: decarboxylating 6-phosphogluconate dehydrogenase [Nitrospirae bacterium]|nr:MAG: decarboxylating 6-phosphogluconate dehydrogenase [Nitrospirota bacterium]